MEKLYFVAMTSVINNFAVNIMAIPVVEFSNQGYKIRKIFA